MRFFKKTSVAVVLTILIAALCCVWGYTRVYVDTVPESSGAERAAGESNLNYYLNWIDDDADLFTLETIDQLARKNLVLDNTYSSMLAVKTVKYLNGMDIQTYAKNTADRIQLGYRDLLLLLDTDSQTWYVSYGTGMTSYIETSQDLPDLFRRHITDAFWTEEGASDEAILALFDDLENWYGHTLPVDESPGGSPFFHSDGKVQAITIGALLSGILLNVMANLWWIVLLLIALNIVDRVRFEKHFTKYPPGTPSAPLFHPFLFWHRIGSNWYAQRMEEAMEEDNEDDFEEEDFNGPTGGPSDSEDNYQRGPGYSTDPNEPGPFGPRSGPGPQVNMNANMSPGLVGQLWQLWRNLLGFFWQCLDSLRHLLRRM